MIEWWFAVLIVGPCLVEFGLSASRTRNYHENENCALLLPEVPGRMRNLCMQLVDVDEAFTIARHKVGLHFPSRDINDQSIAQLGTALQEASRILARRFSLSRREVETLLPRVDTSLTDIRRFCAYTGRTGEDKCREERYRRHDGTCNNLLRPSEGAATFPFRRLLLPQYADSISEPRVGRDGFPLPSPRLVSTTVHGDKSTKHAHLISFMFPAWGQLVDHDLTLTAETKDADTRKDIDCCGGGPRRHPNCLPITIPEDDAFYSKNHQSCMNFARSLAGVRPKCRLGSRVQINMLTSYIDANFVYGSNYRVADSLRALQGGLLKVSPIFDNFDLKPVLPPKTLQPEDGCILSGKPNTFCFLAGDNRVNEQLALGVLHTLTVREHNRIASELGKINPYWDDETVYQEARHILAALVQHITYNEFLPVLLGDKLMEKYELTLKTKGYSNDYDPAIDATVPASFGTAAFRFGHSLLPNAMEMRSANHKKIGEKKLSEMIQQPWDLYRPVYVDAFVLGMVSQPSQAMDSSITHQVTNHLFQEPLKTFGRDLASINIARAREHGVPGYMAFRKLCGFDDMRTWDDMWNHLPNDTVRQYLHLYSHPDDIDLWSAGVSEFPFPGSLLGPVFSCIIGTTFRDLKKGDRFWYENQGFRSSFTLGQLTQIRKYTLSRLLCNTGDNIQTIQIKALLLMDYDKNPRVSCKSKQIPDLDLRYWSDANYNEEKIPEATDSPPTYAGHPSLSLPDVHSTSDYSSLESPSFRPPVLTQQFQTTFGSYPQSTTTSTLTPPYESQTAPFIDSGYERIPPSSPSAHHQMKPEGFDQLVYNLVNDHQQKNKSQFVVELTDSLGIVHNKLDNRRYSTKDVTLQ